MSSKTDQVRFWLEDKGNITSWEAIQHFRATRLRVIIFELRKEGYLIETEMNYSIDENGRKCPYGKYILKDIPAERKMIKENEKHIPSVE